jgi:hypothetical protein
VSENRVVGQSKVHVCSDQWYIAIGNKEPLPALEPGDPQRCRCKKYVDLKLAERFVAAGEALQIVTKRTRRPADVPCRLCHGNPEIKNCAHCRGKGTENVIRIDEEFGIDIVLAIAKRTPRVAVVEEEHILRAYVPSWVREIVASVERGTQAKKYIDDSVSPQEARAAADRIEAYGELVTDAMFYIGKDKISMIVPEPEDNRELGTGRRYDFGRTI